MVCSVCDNGLWCLWSVVIMLCDNYICDTSVYITGLKCWWYWSVVFMFMFVSCLWPVVSVKMICDDYICDLTVYFSGLWCWCLWSVVFILGSVIFVVCSVCDDYICDLSVYISGLGCLWSVVFMLIVCSFYNNDLWLYLWSECLY